MNNKDMPAMPTQVNGGDIYGGLTKREYFAGLAMQGLCANPLVKESEGGLLEADLMKMVSELSVRHADALLEELENE